MSISAIRALRFVRDLAEEELEHAKVGTGAEVALRHIARRARETLGQEPVIDDSTLRTVEPIDGLKIYFRGKPQGQFKLVPLEPGDELP